MGCPEALGSGHTFTRVLEGTSDGVTDMKVDGGGLSVQITHTGGTTTAGYHTVVRVIGIRGTTDTGQDPTQLGRLLSCIGTSVQGLGVYVSTTRSRSGKSETSITCSGRREGKATRLRLGILDADNRARLVIVGDGAGLVVAWQE